MNLVGVVANVSGTGSGTNSIYGTGSILKTRSNIEISTEGVLKSGSNIANNRERASEALRCCVKIKTKHDILNVFLTQMATKSESFCFELYT